MGGSPVAVTDGWERSSADPAATGWWQSTMPWPHGVQEDDDFKWNFGDRDQPIAGADTPGAGGGRGD